MAVTFSLTVKEGSSTMGIFFKGGLEVANESWQNSDDVDDSIRLRIADDFEDDFRDFLVRQNLSLGCHQLHIFRNEGGIKPTKTHDDESDDEKHLHFPVRESEIQEFQVSEIREGHPH